MPPINTVVQFWIYSLAELPEPDSTPYIAVEFDVEMEDNNM